MDDRCFRSFAGISRIRTNVQAPTLGQGHQALFALLAERSNLFALLAKNSQTPTLLNQPPKVELLSYYYIFFVGADRRIRPSGWHLPPVCHTGRHSSLTSLRADTLIRPYNAEWMPTESRRSAQPLPSLQGEGSGVGSPSLPLRRWGLLWEGSRWGLLLSHQGGGVSSGRGLGGVSFFPFKGWGLLGRCRGWRLLLPFPLLYN